VASEELVAGLVVRGWSPGYSQRTAPDTCHTTAIQPDSGAPTARLQVGINRSSSGCPGRSICALRDCQCRRTACRPGWRRRLKPPAAPRPAARSGRHTPRRGRAWCTGPVGRCSGHQRSCRAGWWTGCRRGSAASAGTRFGPGCGRPGERGTQWHRRWRWRRTRPGRFPRLRRPAPGPPGRPG
jgi:hypothetical protein